MIIHVIVPPVHLRSFRCPKSQSEGIHLRSDTNQLWLGFKLRSLHPTKSAGLAASPPETWSSKFQFWKLKTPQVFFVFFWVSELLLVPPRCRKPPPVTGPVLPSIASTTSSAPQDLDKDEVGGEITWNPPNEERIVDKCHGYQLPAPSCQLKCWRRRIDVWFLPGLKFSWFHWHQTHSKCW